MPNPARCALAASLLAVMPASSVAQVDFSGQWELVEESSPQSADFSSPISNGGSIIQDVETLTLTSSRQGARRFNLDGSDSRHVTIGPTGEAFTATSRLRWISNALLIATSHTRPSLPNAWEGVMTLSLDGEGRLVIVEVTPNLWPFGSTTTHRWVYRKTS